MPSVRKTENGGVIIQAEPLERLVAAIFQAAGCEAAEARQVAHYMMDGNLTGHDSHGVIRTGRYVSWIGTRLYPGRRLSVVSETGTIAIVDGHNGFGQIIGEQATRLGIGKAKENGVAIVALRNSGHMGRIGAWAEMAAAENVVFIGFVNVRASLLVAPFSGVERRMSTAPIAIGLPVEGRDPIILDFATSAVAEGKALVTLQGGKPLPPDVLIGPDGTRSNDPKLLYGDVAAGAIANPMTGPGALRALGEHKGSGLAFVTELLAGALTGGGCAGPLPRTYANNMLAIFLDVAAFNAGGGFASEIKSYIEFFTASKPEVAGGRVLVPGDPERLARQDRVANGVPMAGGAWEDILRTAASVGLDQARIDELLG
jgi:hydroxycarboxylate dehydrogenase B